MPDNLNKIGAEERIKLILENSETSYAFLSLDYTVLWENASAISQIEIAKIYKQGTCCFRDFMHRDKPCEDCVMEKAVKSGKREFKVFTLPDKNSVVKVGASPVYKDDKLQGVVLSFNNITEETKNQKLLEEANNEMVKYQKIMDMAIHESDIYIWEYYVKEDRFYHPDGSLMVQYGIDPHATYHAQDFFSLIHPDFKEQVMKGFKNVIEDGKTHSFDCQIHIIGKNLNEYQWYRYKASSIEIDGEKILIGTAMCIDSFVRERVLLTSLIDEAENLARRKSAFLADMSHEIRNPLNAVVGFAEIIAQTEDKNEKAEYLKMMKNNSEQLLNLVNDILDLSKIEAGTMVNRPEPIDLAVVFDEVAMSLGMRLTNPEIKYIIENPYQSCKVIMDRNRMAQVLTNYVTNAFKYTEKGTVTAGYEYVKGGIKIYVKDTGIGIPKDKQDKVFGRFSKLDSYAKGNGLGLSIVKALTEAVGGNVGFTSEEGVGSTFWAWKPGKVEIVKK